MNISGPIQADAVKSLQRGQSTITVGNVSVNAVLSAVTVAKSIVLFTWYTNNDDARAEPMGHVVNPTQVTFQRGNTAGDTVIVWEVIEFK